MKKLMDGKFYLILSEYVGPNRRDSYGNLVGDSRKMKICSNPGRTNSSHEERITGWLGTTNDTSLTAYGEFDSLYDARAESRRLGFSEPAESLTWDDDETIEQWISPEAAREQWDADDWFHTNSSRSDTRAEYGITATTTDDELHEMVERAEGIASEHNVELHGTIELFFELRDELKL